MIAYAGWLLSAYALTLFYENLYYNSLRKKSFGAGIESALKFLKQWKCWFFLNCLETSEREQEGKTWKFVDGSSSSWFLALAGSPTHLLLSWQLGNLTSWSLPGSLTIGQLWSTCCQFNSRPLQIIRKTSGHIFLCFFKGFKDMNNCWLWKIAQLKCVTFMLWMRV